MTDTSPDTMPIKDGAHVAPYFEISLRNAAIKPLHTSNTAICRTPVMEIRSDSVNASQLCDILIKANLSKQRFGTFLPYSFKADAPTFYRQQLLSHEHHLKMLKLIVVYGIPSDIMHSTDSTFGPELSTLHHHLHQVRTDNNNKTSPPLFVSVEPTKSTKDEGKWFLVTTNHTYEQAITFIDDHLPDLCDQFITEKHKNDQDKPSLIPRRPNQAFIRSPDIF